MRIVIDMQGAQTESRFRGIGRYTLSFAQAIARNRGDHEIFLALNGYLSETIEPIRAAFDGLLPQSNIKVWYAPGPYMECEPANDSRRKTAELIREAFLANLNPDVIHISSLFEGFGDDAVSTIGCFDHSTPVSVSLYDLIPMLNPDQYLKPDPAFARSYQIRIDYLKRASIYLAISGSARQEGIDHLQGPESSFVNASTAIDLGFEQQAVEPALASRLLEKLNISQPFVLYTGGADERKNLPRLIQAFALLPKSVKKGYQLVFAGKMSEPSVAELQRHARSAGLKPEGLRFTGYVTDPELVTLYNLCCLYVFPSWHEGFGLPALEAMACGAPVIGANSSSLPEVIGLDKALFDPFDVESIRQKIAQALGDESFREELRVHGLQHAKNFSWDITAARSIEAWKSLHELQRPKTPDLAIQSKPTLAFVSPMPPERSGVADYSAELLPALAEYYEIYLVVSQSQIAGDWAQSNVMVRDADWLRANAARVDRVLYQMGNSSLHQYMLPLIEDIHGTVVLHDFYLSGLLSWLEVCVGQKDVWVRALYQSHGYSAVRERFLEASNAALIYPSNQQVVQSANGIVVHSEYSRALARDWIGKAHADNWATIPLVRRPAAQLDKQLARQKLGLGDSDFIVCSFGFLDATKLNHRLLECWLASELGANTSSELFFVGQASEDYLKRMQKAIEDCGANGRVHITGFASQEQFRQYLMAADVAVQLRAHSRGETSAAVLDCMGHGLPVIANANGSMAELDSDAVCLLPDYFEDSELVNALEAFFRSPEKRKAVGQSARKIITSRHAPDECARLYAEAIERFHHHPASNTDSLIHTLATQTPQIADDALIPIAECITSSIPLPKPAKRLFLDITATCRNDLKTGIERVARSVLIALLDCCPNGYRIEPVYLSNASGRWHYRYARRYTLELLGCPPDALEDDIVEPEAGDTLLGLDLSGDVLVQAEQTGLFADYRNRGVSVYFTVFDLLPVQMPDVFPPGADSSHTRWLRAVSQFDGAVCISQSVAKDLRSWQKSIEANREGRRPFRISWFHLGADVSNSVPSKGMMPNAQQVLNQLGERPTFLMVGTIEPRKGHLKTLEAFETLWAQGVDANLVIVGYEGWKSLPDNDRLQISHTVSRLKAHPEQGKRLIWLQGASDEYVEKVYGASTCLIAASYGEGFGLPLIEAAQHKLPIIARDIPVFREVAGDYASYFNDDADLADTIKNWLERHDQKPELQPEAMPWQTWRDSALQLIEILLATT